uniref:Germin-like protein n=1 Tax=Lactuca sativa TaxID=4236 RepID=A0A9R1UKE6_LACSA|nr:hypothetical protein LSAT_V11C900498900 [Lactuca sativa]
MFLLSFVALTFSYLALAHEPSPLQDFCVADPNSPDFFFSGLHLMGNISNHLGSKVTPVFVTQLPGLNTMGISMVRIDYAPWGLNPPHTHPRATEILTILEGTLQVRFVTSNPDNRFITKVLQKGDVFWGLFISNAMWVMDMLWLLLAFSSQNPGAITIGNAVFGANPAIPADILAKAFQVDKSVVDQLQAKF